MVRLLRKGIYRLIETRSRVKILTLDNVKDFAWIDAGEIGEILVATHKPHKVDHILAVGFYRLYKVEEEEDLTDLPHLELFVGDSIWQGYLLPTGLPTDKKKRNRIIPTKEVITKSFSLKPQSKFFS